MWLQAIPIIGEVIGKALNFINNKWGYNKTEQELEKMKLEIMEDASILQSLDAFRNVILEYEGRASEVPKLILYLRSSWRPLGMYALMGTSIYMTLVGQIDISEFRTFLLTVVAPLYGLREVGKKINSKEG